MKILLRANKVAVEKIKTAAKNNGASFIVTPDNEEYLGIIRYVGDSADQNLKVGQKVFFSTNHQNVRMGGAQLCIMEDKEVFAIVTE